ncbi:hypothetical protein CLV37_101237 [Kineococcus rhizosphaerae]|uniref:Uncharacterized protein n=1 Tax=Kineococcus rhizosphaerae TaxID=559628 RepID=A0A2T0RA11_9ACTN|nr:hypothetical protein CLV37_101237 [Kineococcus rhizosphaerae]
MRAEVTGRAAALAAVRLVVRELLEGAGVREATGATLGATSDTGLQTPARGWSGDGPTQVGERAGTHPQDGGAIVHRSGDDGS